LALIPFFSIQQLLRQRLGDALFSEFENLDGVITHPPTAELVSQTHPNDWGIPINRVKDSERVWYVSAIALKLAKPLNCSPLDAARRLVRALHIYSADRGKPMLSVIGDIGHDVTLQIVEPGWIHIHLADRGLATWLNHLVNSAETDGDRSSTVNRGSENEPVFDGYFSANNSEFLHNSHPVFEIQHVYARCCSILRLGVENSLICLNSSFVQHDQQNLMKLQTLAHLDCSINQGFVDWFDNTTDSLRLTHRAERHLIMCLIDLVDEMARGNVTVTANSSRLSSRAMVSQLLRLTQAFNTFHRYCQIFGVERRLTPSVVNARLGLVFATQITLDCALQALNIKAPQKL
jgi:arginyl-tRNA synthetase